MGTDGVPGDPLEGGDTEPNEIVPEPIVDQPVTRPVRVCVECKRPVFDMLICPHPQLDELVLDVYWDRCFVSGPADNPTWWFCPWAGGDQIGAAAWFAVSGVIRARIERFRD